MRKARPPTRVGGMMASVVETVAVMTVRKVPEGVRDASATPLAEAVTAAPAG